MAPFLVTLLSSGLRLIANAVLVKGSEFIKEKTGIDVEHATLTDSDTEKLRQFQAEHEEELLRLQLEDNKLGLEETKAYLVDVADARKNHTAVQTSADAPWYVKAIQPALAAFIVVATVVLFGLFVYWSGNSGVLDKDGAPIPKLTDPQREIMIYILGVLSAAITQILGYYFGSSKGSAEKSRSMETALRNQSEAK
jgi:hypothetical protein